MPRDHKTCCLFMGHLGLYMGKVTRVREKMVGSAVFLKLVRSLVFSDPACGENRVRRCMVKFLVFNSIQLKISVPSTRFSVQAGSLKMRGRTNFRKTAEPANFFHTSATFPV